MDRAIAALVDGGLPKGLARPPPAPARPVASTAGAGAPTWGPSHPRATSPLSLLAEVAANAHALKRQVETLLDELTGEAPQHRTHAPSHLPPAFLPAMCQLAAEITRTHAEIGQLVSHLRGRL
jgi:hypothetical protein